MEGALLRDASHPRDAVLGIVHDADEDYFRSEAEGGKAIPGVVIYRFESALVFFNADYFSDRVRTVVQSLIYNEVVFARC